MSMASRFKFVQDTVVKNIDKVEELLGEQIDTTALKDQINVYKGEHHIVKIRIIDHEHDILNEVRFLNKTNIKAPSLRDHIDLVGAERYFYAYATPQGTIDNMYCVLDLTKLDIDEVHAFEIRHNDDDTTCVAVGYHTLKEMGAVIRQSGFE